MKASRIWAMARKERLHIQRDFRSLYLAVIIPMVLLLLFGYALKLDVQNVATAVLDRENSPESREFLSRLTASGYFVLEATVDHEGQLQALIDSSRCALGLVIPPDFSARVRASEEAPVQALVDGSNSNRASIILGYLAGIVRLYSQDLTAEASRRAGLASPPQAVDHRLRVWFNEELESRNFIIPGLIGVIMMIVGALMTSLVVAREWERGTMETLLSVPILPTEIILGKLLPYFAIGLFDLALVMALARAGFGIRMQGSLLLLVFCSAVFLYVALALGILVSTATRSQLVANQVGLLATFLPAFLLSGFIFPLDNMPAVIQYVSYLVPARYFLEIVRGIYLRGAGLEQLWPSLLALAVLAVGLTLATFRAAGRQRMG